MTIDNLLGDIIKEDPYALAEQRRIDENCCGSGGCQFYPGCNKFGTTECTPNKNCLKKLHKISYSDLERSKRLNQANH